MEGTGLGLAISMKIVQESGGTINVKSDGRNNGSTFMFTMRMAVEADDISFQRNTPREKLLLQSPDTLAMVEFSSLSSNAIEDG